MQHAAAYLFCSARLGIFCSLSIAAADGMVLTQPTCSAGTGCQEGCKAEGTKSTGACPNPAPCCLMSIMQLKNWQLHSQHCCCLSDIADAGRMLCRHGVPSRLPDIRCCCCWQKFPTVHHAASCLSCNSRLDSCTPGIAAVYSTLLTLHTCYAGICCLGGCHAGGEHINTAGMLSQLSTTLPHACHAAQGLMLMAWC